MNNKTTTRPTHRMVRRVGERWEELGVFWQKEEGKFSGHVKLLGEPVYMALVPIEPNMPKEHKPKQEFPV